MTRKIVVNTASSGIHVVPGGGGGDKVKEYTDLLTQLRDKLTKQIPPLDEDQTALFSKTCLSVLHATAARDAADRARNNVPDDDKNKADAQQAFEEAQQTLDLALQINVGVAKPILNSLDLDKAMEVSDLTQCCILIHGTPEQLGAFANRGPDKAALLDNLLQNDAVLARDVLLAGGARDGKYGEAMEIYDAIRKSATAMQDHDILQILALGTALEQATPMAEFDTPDIMVDPVKRYLHYEQAYLTGELDVTFPDRTVWDCRLITNCDAPNEQLGWGRTMCRNYRPDEMLLDDYVWKYCRLVRTEVGYRRPEWTSTPRTYQQLISGGGECGPRAWFGRFACKMYGIPTWGAKQPGHAMLIIGLLLGILGADWKFSWWEDRCGPDFLLETQARSADNEDTYFNQVRRLELIGSVLGEAPLDGRTGLPDANSLWLSLALMAKKVLAATKKKSKATLPTNSLIKNLAVERLAMKDTEEVIEYKDDDTIIIPATSCSSPQQSTKNIVFMKSFLGGTQLNHRESETLEYTLSDVTTAGTYQVTLHVCTVHLKQQPLLLTVNNESDEVGIANIVVPYTVGEWQYTQSVTIDLVEGTNVLQFERETPNFGLTIKDISLTFVPK